jgi:hypothetical protein
VNRGDLPAQHQQGCHSRHRKIAEFGLHGAYGADERTRTFTPLRELKREWETMVGQQWRSVTFQEFSMGAGLGGMAVFCVTFATHLLPHNSP